jgi:hypothetical protein
MPLAHLYVCSESSSLVRLRVPLRFLVRPPTPEPYRTPPSGEGYSWCFSLPVCHH